MEQADGGERDVEDKWREKIGATKVWRKDTAERHAGTS